MTTNNFQFFSLREIFTTIFNFQKKLAEKQTGFTLVETLVSLVILSLALIPIFNLSSDISRVSAAIQDNLVASGLAQEGAEVIHAIRDTNWFNSRAFDFDLSDGVYQIEWNSIPPLTTATSLPLNLNNSRYTYTGGTPTKFSRTVTITKVNAGELKVVSQVTWQSRFNVSKSITAEDHLFNWK